MRRNTAVAIVVTALAVVLLWVAGRWILALFVGALLALLLRTAADFVSDKTRVPPGWSLAIVLVTLVGLVAISTTLFFPSLADQTDELSRQLPQAVTQLAEWLRQFTWGERLLDTITTTTEEVPPQVVERATTAATTIFDAVVAAIVVLFVGLYLAAEPGMYKRGLLHLIPKEHRTRAEEVLQAVVHTLRWWLLGQLLSMVIVGVLMGIGLALIGVRLAFVFGVLAGLLEFIPIFGPPLAVLPPLLLALVESTQQALYVLILYAVLQTFESNLLTPLVQRRAVHMPPVLTIAAQVIMVAFVGPMGLLVAVPLAATLLVIVQKLYVQDVLGDPVKDIAA